MKPRTQRATSLFALFLVFCVSQVYVGAGFAAPEAAAAVSEVPAPQMAGPVGVLTTVDNQKVIVNGAESITGATILSGASIETPAGVAATVNLGMLGRLEIEQFAKLTLNFQSNSIKVTLLNGCVTLHANKGTTGEIETTKDVVSKTDPATGGVLRVCHPDSVMEASAIAAVPAGFNLLSMLGAVATPAAAIIPAVAPGSNPSISSPTN